MRAIKIKTIDDIFKYVNTSNVDGFLEDFGTWVAMAVLMKESKSPFVIKTECFEWNDDGKYGEINSIRIGK
jgi:hypothetical protein